MAIVDTNVIPIRSNRLVIICLSMIVAAFLSVAVLFQDSLYCSVRNWLLPWSSSVFPELQVVLEPGDTTVEYGDDLIVNAIGLSKNGIAILEYENEIESQHLAVSRGVVRAAKMQNLRHETTYRLRMGKRVSRDYVVRVTERSQAVTSPENSIKPLEVQKTAEPPEDENLPSNNDPDPSFHEILEQQEELRRELEATREKIQESVDAIDEANVVQNGQNPELKDDTEQRKEALMKKASDKTTESRELAESLAKKIDESNVNLENSANEVREIAKKELSDAHRQLDRKEAKDEKSEQAESASEARKNLEQAKEKLDELKQVMEEKQKKLSDAAELEKISEYQKKLAEELSEDASARANDIKQDDQAPDAEWREKQEQVVKKLNDLRKEDQTDQTERMAEACEKCKSAANAPSRREARENAQSAAENLSQIVQELGKKPSFLKNCEKCRNPGQGEGKPGSKPSSKPSSKTGNQPNGTKSVTESPFERLPLRGGASSGWTSAKRQLKSGRLEGRESMIPEDYRDVVTNYFEALGNEVSSSHASQESKIP